MVTKVCKLVGFTGERSFILEIFDREDSIAGTHFSLPAGSKLIIKQEKADYILRILFMFRKCLFTGNVGTGKMSFEGILGHNWW